MVDLITIGIVALIVAVVFLRKTSAGVAILCLLAGVLLDQMLSAWVLGMLPKNATTASPYVGAVVHLLILFTPVVAALIAVKVTKHNMILSLLTSLVLGFLIVLFGLTIVAPLPFAAEAAKNAGLITFLDPYKNIILAASALLAIVEMVFSHGGSVMPKGKKGKKNKT